MSKKRSSGTNFGKVRKKIMKITQKCIPQIKFLSAPLVVTLGKSPRMLFDYKKKLSPAELNEGSYGGADLHFKALSQTRDASLTIRDQRSREMRLFTLRLTPQLNYYATWRM